MGVVGVGGWGGCGDVGGWGGSGGWEWWEGCDGGTHHPVCCACFACGVMYNECPMPISGSCKQIASFSLHGQIGDFGMARDLINESVYVASGGRVPVKWTALEVSAQVLNTHALQLTDMCTWTCSTPSLSTSHTQYIPMSVELNYLNKSLICQCMSFDQRVP